MLDLLQCDHQRSMLIELHPSFAQQDWEELEEFYREKVEEGVLRWELDMRKLAHASSLFISFCIRLHMRLQSHGGALRLVVQRQSSLAEMIRVAKIDKILTVCEI